MSTATAGDDGDLGCVAGAPVDDFVFDIEGAGGVGKGYGFQRGQDQVSWVIDKVFGC